MPRLPSSVASTCRPAVAVRRVKRVSLLGKTVAVQCGRPAGGRLAGLRAEARIPGQPASQPSMRVSYCHRCAAVERAFLAASTPCESGARGLLNPAAASAHRRSQPGLADRRGIRPDATALFSPLVAIMKRVAREGLLWSESDALNDRYCIAALEGALDRHGTP